MGMTYDFTLLGVAPTFHSLKKDSALSCLSCFANKHQTILGNNRGKQRGKNNAALTTHTQSRCW